MCGRESRVEEYRVRVRGLLLILRKVREPSLVCRPEQGRFHELRLEIYFYRKINGFDLNPTLNDCLSLAGGDNSAEVSWLLPILPASWRDNISGGISTRESSATNSGASRRCENNDYDYSRVSL